MSDILARLTTLTQKPKCHRSASRNRRRNAFCIRRRRLLQRAHLPICSGEDQQRNDFGFVSCIAQTFLASLPVVR